MSQPLVVVLPHRLGRQEAVRRLKAGLGRVSSNFGHVLTVQEESWVDNRLTFRVSAVAQTATGIVEVADDHVRLEVTLPWLLARLAGGLQRLISREGLLMLERK